MTECLRFPLSAPYIVKITFFPEDSVDDGKIEPGFQVSSTPPPGPRLFLIFLIFHLVVNVRRRRRGIIGFKASGHSRSTEHDLQGDLAFKRDKADGV